MKIFTIAVVMFATTSVPAFAQVYQPVTPYPYDGQIIIVPRSPATTDFPAARVRGPRIEAPNQLDQERKRLENEILREELRRLRERRRRGY